MLRNCKIVVIAVLFAAVSRSSHAAADSAAQKDPHRPSCRSERCEKIKNFLRKHYCGEPIGNGPDDSCDLREVKKPVPSTRVVADYECVWSENTGISTCKQESTPTPDIRNIILGEMRRIGLPVRGEKEVHYTVMDSTSGWSLMLGNYEHVSGSNVTVCQVIAARKDQKLHILRTLPLKTADADVPEVTRWSPLDVADVDGDGRVEAVLQGDEYENHWLEVIALEDGSFKTIFSGLGYFL